MADVGQGEYSVIGYLRSLPTEQRALTSAVREAVRPRLRGMTEIVYHGAIGYSPTGKPQDRIVYILPASRHVTLGFFFGGQLSDPDGLLEGAGARMRHVKLRSTADVDDPRIAALVEAAAAGAAASLAGLHAKWTAPRTAPTKRPKAARAAR